MGRYLGQHEIIGQRIARILQDYQLLDESVDFALNYFILESGLIFRLPSFCDCKFEIAEVPNTAEEVSHPRLHKVINAKISSVCCEEGAKDWEVDKVCLRMESGVWVGQVTDAPQGTGAAGMLIEDACFFDRPVDFWDIARE